MCFNQLTLHSVGKASVGIWWSWVRISPLPVIPEVALGGHSISSLTIPRCKIGTGLGLEIQGGPLLTSKNRAQVMMDPPWLRNPRAESTEVRNKENQWPHKMVTCHRKMENKKLYICDNLYSLESLEGMHQLVCTSKWPSRRILNK